MNLSDKLNCDISEIYIEANNIKLNMPVVGENESETFIWNEVKEKYNKLGWIETKTPGWFSYGIIFNNEYCKDNSEHCPNTILLLEHLKMKFNIIHAGFSWFKKNTILKSHNDNNPEGEITMHIGIDVPDNCWLIYDDGHKKYQHKNGEFIIFDPRKKHGAFNKSDKDRIILLVIAKPF